MALLALLYAPQVDANGITSSPTGETPATITAVSRGPGGRKIGDQILADAAPVVSEVCGTSDFYEELEVDHMLKKTRGTTSSVRPLDAMRCCQMALVHDLAEALVGDLVVDGDASSRDNITRAEKAKLEEKAILQILGPAAPTVEDKAEDADTSSGIIAKRRKIDSEGGASCSPVVSPSLEKTKSFLLSLWYEYEAQETPEAKFVKDLDRHEMMLQADDYGIEQSEVDLSDFYRSTKGIFVSPIVRGVDEDLRKRYAEREERK
ncbi:unnamed protein product [Amoebophrya sp. A25]|nr:unnamed protein product [Amoebophrya sp. A25]|eukprot:GSA25T00026124001.1